MGKKKKSPTGTTTTASSTAPESESNTDAVISSLLTSETVHHLDPDAIMVRESDNHSRSLIGRYDDSEFGELQTAIEQVGVIQPVLFVMDEESGQPILRVGFRRIEAVKRLRMKYPDNPRFASIPAIEMNPAALNGALGQLRANYQENAYRKRPSAIDDAHAITQFESAGLNGDAIAREMGKSKSWVSKRRKLLTLPEGIQIKVHRGEMDVEVAYELTKKDADTQQAAATADAPESSTGASSPDSGESAGVADGGKAPKKSKAKKAKRGRVKLTRKNVKSAKATGKGERKRITVTQNPGGLAVSGLFRSIAADKKAPIVAKTVAKAVLGFLSGKADGKIVRSLLYGAIPAPKSKPAAASATGSKKAKGKK